MPPPVELDDLLSGDRDAVTLVYFEQLTVEQAALVLATDLAGIGRRLARASAAVAAQVLAADPAPRRAADAPPASDGRRPVQPPTHGRHHRATA